MFLGGFQGIRGRISVTTTFCVYVDPLRIFRAGTSVGREYEAETGRRKGLCLVGEFLGRSACDHVGRRRFVTRKVKKTTLVANVKQEKECQDLQRAIEYMNERHKKACVHDGPQTEVDGINPRIPRIGLLEKKQAMEELLKGLRNTEVEEWRLRRQQLGLKALKRRAS